MRPYEELKNLGEEELKRIEGIFDDKSKYRLLKNEEKTSLMQDYMYLYCKTLPQFDPKMDRRMYGEIKINKGLEKTFGKIAKISYDGKGIKEELQSDLIVEYAAGVSLNGKKDVRERIERYHNDIMFSFDKARERRAAEQKKPVPVPKEKTQASPAAKTPTAPAVQEPQKPVKKRPKLDIPKVPKKLVNTSYELGNEIDQMKAQLTEMEQANKSLFSSSRKYEVAIKNAGALIQLTEKYKKLEASELTPEQRKSIADQLLKNCERMQETAAQYYDRKKAQGKLDDLYYKTDKMDKDSQNRVEALVRFDKIIDKLKRTAKRNKLEAEHDIKKAKSQKEEYDKINSRLDEYEAQANAVDGVRKTALNEAVSRIEQVMNDGMTNYQNGSEDFGGRQHKQMEYCAAAVMVNELMHNEEGAALKKIAPTDPVQYKSFIRGITDSKSFKRALPESLNDPKGLSAFLADKNAALDMGKTYMKDMQAEIKASHSNTARSSAAPRHEAGRILK